VTDELTDGLAAVVPGDARGAARLMIARTPCYYRVTDADPWQSGLFLGLDDEASARVRVVDVDAPGGTVDITLRQRLRMVNEPPVEEFVRRADVTALRRAAWTIIDRCDGEGQFEQDDIEALREALGARRTDGANRE
jgi:hypothetical protein